MNKVTLDEFRQKLIGGGHRNNRFKVNVNFPSGLAIGDAQSSFEFLGYSSTMPAQGIDEIAVKCRGRTVFLPGDLTPPEEWSVTIYNTTAFDIRNTCLNWKNSYIAPDLITGNEEIALPTATIELLGKDNMTVVQRATLYNAWAKTVGAIELSWENDSAISTFQLSIRYDYIIEESV